MPGAEISITFTEAGSLGLKFTPNKQTGEVQILQINSGTQAEVHFYRSIDDSSIEK